MCLLQKTETDQTHSCSANTVSTQSSSNSVNSEKSYHTITPVHGKQIVHHEKVGHRLLNLYIIPLILEYTDGGRLLIIGCTNFVVNDPF